MAIGEVSPKECWSRLSVMVEGGAQTLPGLLIDVRTSAEWNFVGVPQLEASMPPMVGQEWQIYPHMQVDPAFAETLAKRVQELGATTETPLFFLCRSGVRSLHAARAMEAMGYANTFNVVGGFEGDPNGAGQRGHVNGWKHAQLPWRQG